MSQIQSLKSASQVRVNIAAAERIGQERLLLGDSTGQGNTLCPASAHDLNFDQYFRPANQNTLKMAAPDCNGGGIWTASRRVEVENLERPYIPVCAAGFRGGDTAGLGRDLLPKGLYDGSYRGNFVRHYPTANNMPATRPLPNNSRPHVIPTWNLSNEAKYRLWQG